MVVGNLAFEISEDALTEAFLTVFRPYKKLAIDINKFDRFDIDDPRRTLTFLTHAIERISQR